jgi:hypothetical protein
MKPIIFLDIDGVLNKFGFRRVLESKSKIEPKIAQIIEFLDSTLIKMLNDVLTQIDARVVIISDWLLYYNHNDLIQSLKYCGLESEIDFIDNIDSPRQIRILNYLDDISMNVTFVILDDNDFYESSQILHERFIKTNPNFGLQKSDIENMLTNLEQQSVNFTQT